ncbi:hypothetical protein B194_3513 [Serratia plymuthica A30]|nr:hypothetical protein B194_3513 [Serratia plymuthica A30]
MCQAQCDPPANATRSASDNGYLSVQTCRHDYSCFVLYYV